MKHTHILLTLLLLSLFFVVNGQSKIDAWDFGATQLNTDTYTNHLDVNSINSWYSDITAGTLGVNLPMAFTSDILSWTSTSATSDRLRTSNTSLTRYDGGSGLPATAGTETLTGYVYVNAGATPDRYFSLTLNEDDEITIYAKSQNGTGKMTFVNITDNSQTDVRSLTTAPDAYRYVAKKSGTYKIYDAADKPFYYRILRKSATYVTLSGTVDLTNAADIPSGYSLAFTNAEGKTWTATIEANNTFSIQVPSGFIYEPSLADANGYIITNSNSISVEENTTYNPQILKVSLSTLNGNITGLSSTELSQLALTFTSQNQSSIYAPHPIIDAVSGAYSVQLETGNAYNITAAGVNDYEITANSITINENTAKDIAFTAKPTYPITLNAIGLNSTQLSELNVMFSNLNETDYTYAFSDLSNINLRDGVYSVTYSGLDKYPLQLGATSNLTVSGAAVAKDLVFVPITEWTFDDATITSATRAYKGMLFTGSVYNQAAKSHLVLSGGGTAKVPLSPGQKMIVRYYYSADFTVDGADETSTSSGLTSLIESKEYHYQGTENGYMTIANVSGTTYITDVMVTPSVAYTPTLTVGTDKTYQTINAALDAVRYMNRTENDTVQIMIDPGNYDEMLVIDIPNIRLTNASLNPSIALKNKGVDIDENAVRITSYYGHGYNYYSMETNQKWNADALKVNKENGYTSYSNAGAGTTNGSFWNATVVVSATGFRADDIIFENSFNQYISQKESEDVVEMSSSCTTGARPTTVGNTDVQNKSFVERAAAIAFVASGDRAILNKCRVVGRQDSYYGAEGVRVVVYKGTLMGSTDYLFGGMTLVCYQTDLAMNTSEASSDVSYITAAQQKSSRGFLMYNCKITSAHPGTETASTYLSKPGYFGRPWQPTTSEVVFYNTVIETTNNPTYAGQSLILPIGLNNSLGGTSDKVYEYNTTEMSEVNNLTSRATWSQVLTTPYLTDNTEITPFNFTKGTDGWAPLSVLIESDTSTDVNNFFQKNKLNAYAVGNELHITNVNKSSIINVYSANGSLVESYNINQNSIFNLNNGFWIVNAVNSDGNNSFKIIIR